MINEKRKQMEIELGDLSRSLDHNPYPLSRNEKWKRARQQCDDSFTLEATCEVAGKIVRIYFIQYYLFSLTQF